MCLFLMPAKNLVPNDGQFRIEFDKLSKIGMGAPIGGKFFLHTNTNSRVLLNQCCGGPVVWEAKSNKIALSIWNRTFLKGTVQQIAIADTETGILTIYAQIFRVLDLRTFEDSIIWGMKARFTIPKC